MQFDIQLFRTQAVHPQSPFCGPFVRIEGAEKINGCSELSLGHGLGANFT